MSEQRPETDAPGGEQQNALIGLHALTGTFGPRHPSAMPNFRPVTTAAALSAVATASEQRVPIAARLHVLHRLARAGFPDYDAARDGYEALAASIAAARPGISADALLDDVKQSAREAVPFAQTPSGRTLGHRDTAFVDREVCQIRTVEVNGLRATWIFSEFETDASFESVAEWVDPHNWPERGPLLFKSMAVVPGEQIQELGPPGDTHWHGPFREVVQIVDELTTDLHCDFWLDRTAGSAGMTYELDKSIGDQINVDRGFLLVSDTGGVRRVKALKIVGFTGEFWDDVATFVCPFWTDWVRGAVEGGSTSTPAAQAPGANPLADNLADWLQFAGDSARSYLDIFTDVTGRLASGKYDSADWVGDGIRTWSQLAKDWARAWTYGMEAISEVADQGLDAGLTPPGTPREQARGAFTALTTPPTAPNTDMAAAQEAGASTTIPWPGLTPQHRLICSSLQSIEAPTAVIGSQDLTVDVVRLAGDVPGARVRTTATAPAGLYVGYLQTESGQQTQPVQLYVSGASKAGGP